MDKTVFGRFARRSIAGFLPGGLPHSGLAEPLAWRRFLLLAADQERAPARAARRFILDASAASMRC